MLTGVKKFLRRHKHGEEVAAESAGLQILWMVLRRVGVIGAVTAAAAVTTVTVTSGSGPTTVNVPANLAALTHQQKVILALAKDWGPNSGILYVWGGSDPRVGFDCSGFILRVYQQANINVPRTSFTQWSDTNGVRVAKSDLRPGDEVFFVGSDGTWANPGHVGLYVGGGNVVEYYSHGLPAKEIPLAWHNDYVGAKRWWKPVQVRKRTYKVAVWIARHWGVKITGHQADHVLYVPNGRKYFRSATRRSIIRWANSLHLQHTGNRQFLSIKLYPLPKG